MSEQGHYEVTLHRRRGWDRPLRRTFPFGQWAEVGFWLDEVGAGEGDSLAVTFHPLTQPSAEARWVATLDTGIEELELGVRAYNILKRRGIDSCGQLLQLDLAEIEAWDVAHASEPLVRYGRQARQQIREAQLGLQSLRIQLQVEHEAEASRFTVVSDGGHRIVDAESPELHSVRAELYETNERGLCHELGIEKAPQWEEGA